MTGGLDPGGWLERHWKEGEMLGGVWSEWGTDREPRPEELWNAFNCCGMLIDMMK